MDPPVTVATTRYLAYLHKSTQRARAINKQVRDGLIATAATEQYIHKFNSDANKPKHKPKPGVKFSSKK
jgi:hypothetical protein